MKDNKVLLEACEIAGVYLVKDFTSEVFVCGDFDEFEWRLKMGHDNYSVVGYGCTLEEARKVQAVYGVSDHPGGRQANLDEVFKTDANEEKKPTVPPTPLVATRAVTAWSAKGLDRILWLGSLIDRFMGSDWGDVCSEDWQLNDNALRVGNRVLGAYEPPEHLEGKKVYVILEADRSVITILFYDEY